LGFALLLALCAPGAFAAETRGPAGENPVVPIEGAGAKLPELPKLPATIPGVENLAPLSGTGDAASAAIRQAGAGSANASAGELQAGAVSPVVPAAATPSAQTPDLVPSNSNSAPKAESKDESPESKRIWGEAEARGFAHAAPRLDEVSGSESTPQALAPSSTHDGRHRSDPPSPRKTTRDFLSSLLVAQIGVEIMGLAVPQLANRLSGDFSAAAWLGAACFAAQAVGSLIAGPAVDRWGIRPAYLASLAARTAAGTAIALLHPGGALTLAALVTLFGFDYLALGVSRVAEGVVPTALHGGAQGKVTGFTTWQNMVIEAMGIVGLTLGGFLLAAHGFGAALAAYPVLTAASALLVWRRLKLRGGIKHSSVGLRARLSRVWAAVKLHPAMRKAAAGYALSSVLSGVLYFAISPNFGLYAARFGWTPSIGAFAVSVLYAAGSFAATVGMAWLYRRHERRLEALPEGERAAADRGWLRLLTARSSRAAGLAMIGGVTLALTPVLGPWPALGFMVLFGMADAAIFISTESLLKTEAPETVRGSVLGIARAGALLLTSLVFPLLGLIFDFFAGGRGLTPGDGAFVFVSAALAAAGAAYLLIARGLKKAN
jgi:MFS family permease